MHISNHIEYYRKKVLPHRHKTQLHFSPMCFYLEYNGYRSHAKDNRLSLTQTIVMVHSQLQLHSNSSCKIPDNFYQF